MDIHTPAIANLKCPTCLVVFDDQETHKIHYKSDYHRYNLKRKTVKLAPVTQQQFKAKKVEAQLEEETNFKCNQCGKKFSSAKTFDQHVQTKKHNPNLQRVQQALKSKPETKKQFIKNNKVCLFCLHPSQSFSDNLRHMNSSHSFFIAQHPYCTNEQKLIQYLQQKIEVGFMCITCQNKNAKDFNSGQSVRKHMIDKGHTFMKIEQGFDEYLEFYDFSEQFKQILESQKDKYVPGIEFTTMKVVANARDQVDDDEEGEWQDDDSDSSDSSVDVNETKKKQSEENDMDEGWESDSSEENEQQHEEQIKQKEQKNKKKVKTYHIMRPTHTANGELLLPNGKILGHRKFRYLYRQTYRPQFWLNQNIKALGYQFGINAIISRQKLMELAKNDRLLFKTKVRWDKKLLSVGMQNNSLQKYYRSRNSL